MNNFEENAIKIANYLEDRMSPLEEEIFMQELEIQTDLRQQYEDELLVSALLQNEEELHPSNELLFQSADKHVEMIEKALEIKATGKDQAPVIKIFRYYKQVAAALIVLVLGSVLFILLKKKNEEPVIAKTSILKSSDTATKQNIQERMAQDSTTRVNSTVKTQPQKKMQSDEKYGLKDSSQRNSTAQQGNAHPGNISKTHGLKKDSITNIELPTKIQSQQIAGSDSAEKMQQPINMIANAKSIFQSFYRSYSKGENDPVEISDYYNSYKAGDYTKVIAVKEADYRLMGSGRRNDLLNQYINLYKGLAYIGENKPRDALQKFDLVLQSSLKSAPQYYDAQWYSMLTWLKVNEMAKTKEAATLIIQSSSPYKNKAAQLMEDLKSGK